MHARNGNTYSQFAASSSKGRGKTKTKGQQTRADAILSPEIQEEMFRNAIKDAMPLCQKQQSADWSHARVVPAEWKSPVLHHSEMTSAGGICSASKQCIPDLLRQIGYTQAPTAMLCTQHPQELGLRGYPVQEQTCTFQVREDDGTEKSIFVRRHLVQLGFGKPVTQNVAGDLVYIPTHMHKIVVTLPSLLDGDLKHAMPERLQSFWSNIFQLLHMRTSPFGKTNLQQFLCTRAKSKHCCERVDSEPFFWNFMKHQAYCLMQASFGCLLNSRWMMPIRWRKVMTPHLELSQRIAR